MFKVTAAPVEASVNKTSAVQIFEGQVPALTVTDLGKPAVKVVAPDLEN